MQLEGLGSAVSGIQNGGRLEVICDSNVAGLYAGKCIASLEKSGFDTVCVTLPAGESSKNGGTYLALLEKTAEHGLTRSDGIVALGGGMTGDLAGFVAATYMRGIRLIEVPTTLLALVDSSIGGKTGIDLKEGKNMAGAFHEPELIYRDITLLDTLPEKEFRSGTAEVIKYGMIRDPEILDLASDLGNVRANLDEIVKRCVAIKEDIVSRDLYDRGERRMLNFGHTIGHAVETLSGLSLSHGDCVAMGMMRISEIAAREGWCSGYVPQRLNAVLDGCGFDLEIPYGNDMIFEAVKADKKRKGDSIDLIVPERIGSCRTVTLTMDELEWLLA